MHVYVLGNVSFGGCTLVNFYMGELATYMHYMKYLNSGKIHLSKFSIQL